ncbi:MAG: FadR family transcriptional regulator [Ruminococcaceae bacterium]|nr:FadR family transcriptional regulator [Oscillospiraceae bacterium]
MEKSIPSESSVNQIVDGMKQLMIDRKLKVGDKLPTEFELSNIFGKSRGSIREAIKILVSYGVLEIRRGDGTYVSASIGSGVFDALFFQVVAMGTDISELIQLREILESGIIKAILDRNDDDYLQEIIQIQERLSAKIERDADIDELVEIDLLLHRKLAMATHNVLLEKVYGFTLDIFAPLVKYSYIMQRTSNAFSVQGKHATILQALEEHDYDLGRYAIRQSLKDWLRLNELYQQNQESGKA